MEDKVVSLYALGTSTRDIQAHIKEWYGYEMSPETVSRITDSRMTEANKAPWMPNIS